MNPLSERTLDVLGIGAPVCDYVLRVSDAYLLQIPGDKNGMQRVSLDTLHSLIQESGEAPLLIAGGSGANTIKGLARLGHKTALLGKIGADSAGETALSSLRHSGVMPYFIESQTPTTQVLCLVAPTGSRTFRSFLGASGELKAEELPRELFCNARLVHIEGYTIQYDHVLECAMEFAKASGAVVSYDLGSHELVASHQKRILDCLDAFVDVLFCNQDELEALLHLNPEQGCMRLRELCEVVVILLGKDGCLVGNGPKQNYWPAYPVNSVDTTGAGDLFAAGFLHGYLNNRSMTECAHYGSILASSVIQVVGAEIPEPFWKMIQREHLIP